MFVCKYNQHKEYPPPKLISTIHKFRYLLNGAFFTSSITGQQRFASNILLELDNLISHNELSLIVPKSVSLPAFKNIKIIRFGSLKGKLWEQTELALYLIMHRCKAISFCNSTPLLCPGPTFIHDILIKLHPEFLNTFAGKLSRFFYINCLRRATNGKFPVLTVSEFSKNQISKYCRVPHDKIIVISNAWQHFEKIDEDDSFFHRNPNIRKGEYYFSLGSRSAQKNLNFIYENAKYYPDRTFVITGKNVRNFKQTENLPENVIHTGFIPDNEIKSLISNCKAFVFPSVYEGFGIPPLEALSLGKRIICSDIPVCHEIFENSVNYINPLNYKIDLDLLLAEKPSDAKEKILEKYSWKKSAQKFYDFYKSLNNTDNKNKLPEKILFVSNTANFSKFNRPLIKELTNRGYCVDYCSLGEEDIPVCINQYKIDIARSPLSLKNIKALIQLKKIIKLNDYKIIHCHTPMGGVLARLAAKKDFKKKRIKIIYTAHGFHFYNGAPLLRNLVYFFVEFILSFYTSVLVTMNNEDFCHAKKYFKKPEIFKIPSTGYNYINFFPVSISEKFNLRKELGLNPTDFIIIYTAEFIPRKNHKMSFSVLSDIKKQIPNAHLVLLGKGKIFDEAKAMANSMNIAQDITFAGYVKNTDEYCKASDLFISTSFQEGIPVSIIEAMACGLPVVASKIRGHTDLIKNYENGLLCDVNSKEEFENAIQQLYADKELYEKIKNNNISACKIHNSQNIVSNMMEIYSTVF